MLGDHAYLYLLVSRVKLVKPERAAMVENHLIRSAQGGQLRGKVDENGLRGLLTQVSTQESKPKVTVSNSDLFYLLVDDNKA